MGTITSVPPIKSGLSFRFDLGNKPKRNGEYAIMLRITEGRRLKRVYIEVDVRKEWWDSKKELVKRSDPESIPKNLRLSTITGQIHQLQHTLSNPSAEQILKILKGEKPALAIPCFFEYAQKYLTDKPFNTIKNTTSILNKVAEFAGNRRLPFVQIDLDFVKRFEFFLKKQHGNNDTTVDINLSKVKAIINHAIRNGFIPFEYNPFRMYRIKEGKPQKDRLTEQEVQRLIDCALEHDSLEWHTRNYWLFAYYSAGIRFGDVATLRWTRNIIEDAEGNTFASYQMHKTGSFHTLKLPKAASDILRLYSYRKALYPDSFVFPILNQNLKLMDERVLKIEISRKNALINKYLKRICKKADISKTVSFHTARHTFANIARKRTDLFSTSKLLGHTRLSITQQYFDEYDEWSMVHAVEEIFPH